MPTAILTFLTFASALNLGHIDLANTSSFSSIAILPGIADQAQTIPSNEAELPSSSIETYEVRVTAYSSSPDETDSTPFITASGKHVHDGFVAANFLPFGTKLIIPELFGERIFTVEDRMNKRMPNGLDIWMSSKAKALRFGAIDAKIVVITDLPQGDSATPLAME